MPLRGAVFLARSEKVIRLIRFHAGCYPDLYRDYIAEFAGKKYRWAASL
jgi:hypothetical protein